jgi:hypothetical protein
LTETIFSLKLELRESNARERSKTPIPKSDELPDLEDSDWNTKSPATIANAHE